MMERPLAPVTELDLEYAYYHAERFDHWMSFTKDELVLKLTEHGSNCWNEGAWSMTKEYLAFCLSAQDQISKEVIDEILTARDAT